MTVFSSKKFSSKSRRDSFSFFFILSSTNSLESSPTSELDQGSSKKELQVFSKSAQEAKEESVSIRSRRQTRKLLSRKPT